MLPAYWRKLLVNRLILEFLDDHQVEKMVSLRG
jgi:hypothetical protein